jgi:ABC-type multidrug transport system ATPase subunit
VGRVLYDGLPAGDTRVAKLVGFVPQDDIIHTDLTVW